MCGKQNPAEAEVCRFCNARLKPLWADSPSPTPPDHEKARFDGFELPEWLSEESFEPTDEASRDLDSASQPDWLSDLRDDSEDSDWLHRINADEQPELPFNNPPEKLDMLDGLPTSEKLDQETTQTEAESPDEAQKIPDWLLKLKETPPPEPEPFDQEESAPDWFSDLHEDVLSESESLYPPENIPDWFTGIEETGQSISEPEPVEDNGNLPDWLSGVLPPSNKPDSSSEADFPAPIQDASPAMVLATDDDETFETDIADLDLGDGLADTAEKKDRFGADFAWLDEMQLEINQSETTPEEYAAEESFELRESVPDQGDALPDWLSRVSESTGPVSPAFTEEGSPAEIPAAELPYWLKAMRPVAAYNVDGVIERSTSEQAEKSGPLAGLIGALPAEPDISQSPKPPVYSSKLQISDTQKLHAQLFTELIQAEGESKSLPTTPLIKSGSLIRMMIALILYAVVIVSLLSGFPALNLPAISADVNAAHQLAAGAPPGSPVLIAVDYAPGFRAEIEAGLSALTSQLVDQDCHLIFVSSLPTGPIQSAHFVTQGMKLSPQQSLHWTNLGYIPGGAAGLLAFAQDPTRVLPYDANGNQAWADPRMQGFRSLSDLSLVIVATENPDTARTWIEQVRPLLKTTPLMMVVSAQNAPIIRPYYDSYPKQVQGLISGLTAAVEYDTLAGRSGPAGGLWSPFTAALSAITFLILVGAIVNFGLGALARSRSSVRGEGEK